MKRNKLNLIIIGIGMLIFTLLIAYPMIMILFFSFKTKLEIAVAPLSLPQSIYLQNYITAVKEMDFFNSLKNSVVITAICLILGTFIYCMASYACARANIKKKLFKGFYLFMLAGLALPVQLAMVSQVYLLRSMHLIGKLSGLELIYLGGLTSFSMFILYGFVKTIPISLDESAMIDGGNYFTVFAQIMMPLMKPVIMTLVILNGVTVYNDFMQPMVFLSGKAARTLPLTVFYFRGQHTTDWGVLFAALAVASAPAVLFYFYFQNYIVSGLISGAIKG